jgi:hypothetical protein
VRGESEPVGDAPRIERRRPNVVARVIRAAISGQQPGLDLVVRDGVPNLKPYTVSLPDAPDLAPDAMSTAIRTATSIRRRFGPAVAALRRMSFDLHDPRMQSGHFAGLANLNLATAHLNSAWVTESGRAQLAARGGAVTIGSLVAHELWHLIELAWEVRDYRATIRFRTELGAHFGVATIEHAVRGNAQANEQLRREVSAYAGTGSKEATAEMFEQWWTGDNTTPAIAHFGALVDRYLPPPFSAE